MKNNQFISQKLNINNKKYQANYQKKCNFLINKQDQQKITIKKLIIHLILTPFHSHQFHNNI